MPVRPVEIMEKHTYDADKDGRIEKDAIEITLNKLLKGAGGADPTEVDTDASLITTGRFGVARMPDGTSGQVLTAQGVGVDPAYAAAGSVLRNHGRAWVAHGDNVITLPIEIGRAHV